MADVPILFPTFGRWILLIIKIPTFIGGILRSKTQGLIPFKEQNHDALW